MERYTGVFLPSGDPKMAEEFVSPNIVVHFAGQELRGRKTYLDIVAANAAAFPDLKWTVEGMVADGDTVAVRYKMTGPRRGTFAGVPATGKAIVSQSMTFYRLVDGKIVDERALLDMLSILQQMDAVPRA